MVTTHIWLLVSMAMRSSESSSHWQSPRIPAKSFTRRGGSGRGGTCATVVCAANSSNRATARYLNTLFQVALIVMVVVSIVVFLVTVIKSDLVA